MTVGPEPFAPADMAVPPRAAVTDPEKAHAWGTSMTLVLGADDDDRVGALVDRTAQLALERHASVLVLHAVHRSEVWALASLMIDSRPYLQARRRRLERRVAAPLCSRGIDARAVVQLGEPAHQLAHIAARYGADLIVIGGETHERKHHLVGGGVARRLEHLTAVPVEVVAPAVLGAAAGHSDSHYS
ncbi:MAG TPA: universal stress protein [Acidimicrobiia bacterium]|jgi:nucleotide-binding universal stress UspA family protein|nr:universal stress protein [Acidimicrobiia bacterium]